VKPGVEKNTVEELNGTQTIDRTIDQAPSDQPSDSILTGHIPYLRRYARGLARNTADADDLVQSCLLRALTNLHRFEHHTNLRAWLMTILHNIFIDVVRKNKRARDAFATAGITADGVSQGPSQFQNLQVVELELAIERLPAEQRSTLLLIVLEGMSYDEAAHVTRVPVGTVRSRLSRARHTLLAAMEGAEIVGLQDRATRAKRPMDTTERDAVTTSVSPSARALAHRLVA
jgi:RNA polymerase sigma-70 factor (ECF subfamily)